MNDHERVKTLIAGLLEELLEAQELAPGGRIRDLMKIAGLRSRLFGLRSELALLGDKPDHALAVSYADREKRFMHEARQIAKQVIADELEELRAYVLEGTQLEDRASTFDEKPSPPSAQCGPDPNGTASASSAGSDPPSPADSSTSP